jgi:ABC-2 type transport system permease protein
VFLLIVSSLGVGFLIAGFAGSDTEAVNMSMIVLLLSIFFSGFFLSLDRLLPEVRTVSWLLPITHALDSLRDVMFRGTGIDLRTWVALGGGSIALYLAGWSILYRRMRPA